MNFVLEGGSSAIMASLNRLKAEEQQGIMVLFKLTVNRIRSHIIQYVQYCLIFASLFCPGLLFECTTWSCVAYSKERAMLGKHTIYSISMVWI